MERFKKIMMDGADILNAWRVIPRLMAGMYGFMVYKLFLWFTAMETFQKESCDSGVLNTLINNGVDPTTAMDMTCTVAATVGGPTSQQTAFVTAIIGLSTAIFAFYVGSGNGRFSVSSISKQSDSGCNKE